MSLAFVSGIGRYVSLEISNSQRTSMTYVNYKENYAFKNIRDLGIQKVQELQDICAAGPRNKYGGMSIGFGLGAVQWSFERTQTLLDCYKEVCGDNNFPTREQCIMAENLVIARELENNYNYVYKKWKKEEYGSIDAYGAGYGVCIHYEEPQDKEQKAIIRGEQARQIYNIMIGKK